VVAALVRTFLVQPFYIPSGSMENTLHVGDRVLVDKVSYRFHDIQRGDVVVFDGADSFAPEVRRDPGNPLLRPLTALASAFGLAPPGEHDFIKRVIGLPGDRVACCDRSGRVTVNGRAIEEQAYLFPGDRPSKDFFSIKVPPGRLWVMGDHRAASVDSRAHLGDPGGGTVPEARVIGRAMVVLWPLNRIGGLARHSTYALRQGHALPSAVALDAATGTERVTR
jgi:signal peptidase I